VVIIFVNRLYLKAIKAQNTQTEEKEEYSFQPKINSSSTSHNSSSSPSSSHQTTNTPPKSSSSAGSRLYQESLGRQIRQQKLEEEKEKQLQKGFG